MDNHDLFLMRLIFLFINWTQGKLQKRRFIGLHSNLIEKKFNWKLSSYFFFLNASE